MCIACTEYQLGNLTKAEARRNIDETPAGTRHSLVVLEELEQDDSDQDYPDTDRFD